MCNEVVYWVGFSEGFSIYQNIYVSSILNCILYVFNLHLFLIKKTVLFPFIGLLLLLLLITLVENGEKVFLNCS